MKTVASYATVDFMRIAFVIRFALTKWFRLILVAFAGFLSSLEIIDYSMQTQTNAHPQNTRYAIHIPNTRTLFEPPTLINSNVEVNYAIETRSVQTMWLRVNEMET